MDTVTHDALLGSIKKWQAIVNGEIADEGSRNCPLCHLFIEQVGLPACSGCPVQEISNSAYCAETPYEAWYNFWASRMHTAKTLSGLSGDELGRARELAQAELDFLKSLLP